MHEQEPLPVNAPFEFSDRVSHSRLLALLNDEQTTIHSVGLSENNYGAFLFVDVSRPRGEATEALTFYGLGYHEHRERWIGDTWSWYRANDYPARQEQRVSREEALSRVEERLEEITPHLGKQTQSPRAQFYEFLADLTDEDGALSEMEDLEGIADWLFGDEDETE